MTTDPAHPGGRRAGECREQDGPDRHGARADGSQLSSTASPPVSLSEAGGRPTDSDSPQTPAQRWDALVVGGGIAGLTAAWDLVRAGLRPLLVEARGYTGGLVAAGRIGGARLDLGAEGFVVRGEAATSMLGELGLRTTGPHGRPRLFLPPLAQAGDDVGEAGGTDDGDESPGWALHRFPDDAYLGIPADPLAPDVVSIIGRAAARRAAKDADLPGSVGTGPEDPADLASFVTARMGTGVLERLVRPIVAGIHSADPADLAADVVVPGLRRATAELGSLSAAVAAVLERRRGRRDGAGGGGGGAAGGGGGGGTPQAIAAQLAAVDALLACPDAGRPADRMAHARMCGRVSAALCNPDVRDRVLLYGIDPAVETPLAGVGEEELFSRLAAAAGRAPHIDRIRRVIALLEEVASYRVRGEHAALAAAGYLHWWSCTNSLAAKRVRQAARIDPGYPLAHLLLDVVSSGTMAPWYSALTAG